MSGVGGVLFACFWIQLNLCSLSNESKFYLKFMMSYNLMLCNFNTLSLSVVCMFMCLNICVCVFFLSLKSTIYNLIGTFTQISFSFDKLQVFLIRLFSSFSIEFCRYVRISNWPSTFRIWCYI